jgi:hypothetical protein
MQIVSTQTSGAIRTYFRNSAAPVQAAALTLPLLCLYGLGILVSQDAQNGVDFFTQGLYVAFRALGPWRQFAYLGFYGLLAGVNVALFLWLRQRNQLNGHYFLPLLIECTVYAMVTGVVSVSVTRDVTHMLNAVPLVAGARSFGLFDGLIVSAGAGLHEELVFRLVGIGLLGRVWLGKDWRKPSQRLAILVVATSVVFSLAHYLGAEPFQIGSFVFRTVSGGIFALLFLTRGFAVAAWTHALYDVWVIVVVGG